MTAESVLAERVTGTGEVLIALLRDAGLLAADAPVAGVARLSGGHSHVTWLVEGIGPTPGMGSVRYVVKVAQKDGPLAPYDISHEVGFVRIAREHGLPAPEVVLVSETNALDEPLFAMQFVAGQAPTPREILPWLDAHPAVTGDQLARELFSTLAGMRAITVGAPNRRMGEYYREYVAAAMASLGSELAGTMDLPASIDFVAQRLLAGASLLGDAPLSLVHGDFRFGNLMLSEDGVVVAILDWERAMWGHHLHDLAYLSLPTMRYRGRIAGLVNDDEALALWEQDTGEPVDLAALSYLRSVSIFTELCACGRALAAYARGRGRLSLLRILPIIARHEVDMLDSLDAWAV